jgi:hypothetical protein
MVWVVHIYVPSDMGGLSRVLRPLLPYVTVAVLVDIARFIRGAAVGAIEINAEGLELPWFWWGSHRMTRWSEVVSVEKVTVVGFGLRNPTIRLIGSDGRQKAVVTRRWVREWDELIEGIQDRCGEIRARPPQSAWSANTSDGVNPWLPRKKP